MEGERDGNSVICNKKIKKHAQCVVKCQRHQYSVVYLSILVIYSVLDETLEIIIQFI
jgi:hypothetical protein